MALLGSAFTAQAQHQLKNAGFEEWEDVTYSKYSGQEPVNWNSFLTGTGSLKGTAGRNQLEKSTEVRPGSTGTYSAKLLDRKVFGAIYAQGNLTTGCINMASMSAADAKGNYNYTKEDDENLNQKFIGRPDAMHVWVKYVSTNSSFRAKANTVLHTEGYYQDPEGNTITAMVVAKAEKLDIASSNDWQELTLPFVYTGQADVPAYALVSFATNATPGKGTGNDYMLVDDLEYIYNSQLASLSYNGTPVAGFDKDVYAYTVQGDYTDGCLEAVKNCMGGTCTIGAYDEANKTVTITVKGDDWSEANKNEHSYVVTFVEAQPEVTEYTNLLTVSIDGVTTAPQETTIQLIKELDGSYSFALNNFMLDGGDGSIMPVGNIKLNNLAIDSSVFTANQVIRITPGTPEDAGWIGPYLEDVPVALKAELIDGNMVADIDIDMTALLGQSIKVVFAPSVVLKDTEAFGTSVIPVTRTYKDKLTVTIDGSSADPQDAEIIVENLVDGTCNLSLKNFSLFMGGDAAPVGNINVKGLTMTDAGTYKVIAADQVIQITPGEPEDAGWIGPMLGDVPIKLTGKLTDEKLYCTIDIDMSETLGQVIAVVFGNDFEGGVSLKNLKNVTLQRTFKAGWNTVCLPFDYSLITFGEKAKAQAFVSATAEGLNFESVEEMKANVPYLLYLPNDITTPLYFGVNVAPATPVAVTYGDFTFTGTYEPMSMAGKYGVATVDGVDKIVKGGANATVKGTRAYFTSTNANIKEMPLLIDGVATGVAGVQAAEDAAYDVYTLTGIQVRKGATTLGGLPKGIYIVNGKKMYIK